MKKVLLVRLSSMGDIIFHIPLANLFKKQGYQVGWLVSEKGYDLLKGNPCVDNLYLAPLGKWKKQGLSIKNFFEYLNILKEIRNEKYDIAIDLQRMFKSMYWMMFCGAKRRIISKDTREFAELGANEVIPSVDKENERHVTLNSFEFAKYLGLDCTSIDFTLPESSEMTKSTVDEFLQNIDKSKPCVVIAPATTREFKHWNKDNWKAVVEEIQNFCNLIFTGTESDRDLLSYIGADKHINLCGKTNLQTLIELFRRVDIVMSPDSGSAHLAWASRKPAVISIFTITSPKRFGAFGDDEKYFALSGNLDCQPCISWGKCPYTGEKYGACTNYPTAEQIINIVKKILKIDTTRV